MGEVLTNQSAVNDASLGQVDAFNVRLRAVAGELIDDGVPHQHRRGADGVTPSTSTYDGTHPNSRGEYLIAKAYSDVLASVRSVPGSVRCQRRSPRSPAPAALTADPSSNAALLKWTAVPGSLATTSINAMPQRMRRLVACSSPCRAPPSRVVCSANGHRYEFRVASIRYNEEGAQSPVALALPVGVTPAPPTALAATARDGAALLFWTESSGADGYYVYQRDVTAGASFGRLPFPFRGLRGPRAS